MTCSCSYSAVCLDLLRIPKSLLQRSTEVEDRSRSSEADRSSSLNIGDIVEDLQGSQNCIYYARALTSRSIPCANVLCFSSFRSILRCHEGFCLVFLMCFKCFQEFLTGSGLFGLLHQVIRLRPADAGRELPRDLPPECASAMERTRRFGPIRHCQGGYTPLDRCGMLMSIQTVYHSLCGAADAEIVSCDPVPNRLSRVDRCGIVPGIDRCL